MKGYVCTSEAKRRQIRNEMRDMCVVVEPNAHVCRTYAAPMELRERDVMHLLGLHHVGHLIKIPSKQTRKHLQLTAYASNLAHKPNATATEMARALGFTCPDDDYLRGSVVFLLAPNETESGEDILGRPIPNELIRAIK